MRIGIVMRLTRHLTNEELDIYNKYRDDLNKRTYSIKIGVGTLAIENKLGQLEDIEEELGIDLITLFKALTNDVYLYHNNKIIKCEQAPILLNFGEEDKKEYGFEFYFQDEQDVEQVYFKDYGKTWALTKEELL